jgi:hypothetical protein
LKSSNGASFVMPAAANQRQAPSSRSLGAVHDGHERSEFGRMQAPPYKDSDELWEIIFKEQGFF